MMTSYANAGDQFQMETKYERDKLPGGGLDWASKPGTYKRYPAAKRVALPPPETAGGAGLWDVLVRRRSVRRFQGAPLGQAELSQLLWAAQGITLRAERFAFRTAPSAGALYPVETYLVIHSVDEIEPGVYHYAVEEHELEQLRSGDYHLEAANAALDQSMAAQANAVFVWTAIFGRSKWKYRQRAYRYIYLDAGHIAAHVSLAAVALGLGSCQVGALYDDEANALLGVDGEEESTIYMTVVGRPR
jgi:SagB-type dehydrogenase family enzyme